MNLFSTEGFKEIKHIEISGLAPVVGSAVPEASTWAMMGLGFAGLGLLGYRKTRSDNALAKVGGRPHDGSIEATDFARAR